MRNFTICLTTLLVTASLILSMGGLAQAQDKPSWMVVPYPPGGPMDTTARNVQPLLQVALGSRLMVDNVVGAGGAIGIQKMLNAPLDGNTLLMGSISDVVLTPLSLKASKYQGEDLKMVGVLSQSPLVLIARPSLVVNDARELVAYAKNPVNNELFYGTIGRGSIFHLVNEDFIQQAQIKMTHVPYKGLAPLAQDLMGNQVDLAFYPLAGNVFSLINSGKVKALAITGNVRAPQIKNVPTFNELGVTKNFDYSMWPAVFMSAKVSDEAARKVNAALQLVVKTPEFLKFCEETGTTPNKPMSLAETDKFYKAEMQAFRMVAKLIRLETE